MEIEIERLGKARKAAAAFKEAGMELNDADLEKAGAEMDAIAKAAKKYPPQKRAKYFVLQMAALLKRYGGKLEWEA
jgi:hypothetical protein